MPAAAQPDLLAAVRLVRDLQDADSLAAVRGAVLTDLPRLIRCDTLTWATRDLATMRLVDVADSVAAAGRRGPAAPRLGHQVRLDFAHDGRLTDLAFRRARRDFTDAELALLELLRPHLLAAVRRTARADRLAVLHLTRRERAVLELVAAGASNLTIARQLQMRPRTVEKHLEHAYGKLGVSSRTAAVAALRAITH
jgi:DNA-binding NarL/FixJ family response regulator